jgi:hypothetical protein
MTALLVWVASRIGTSTRSAALMRALVGVAIVALLAFSVSMALGGRAEVLASGIAWGK